MNTEAPPLLPPISFKLLPGATLPSNKNIGDVGLDICWAPTDPNELVRVLKPGTVHKFETGVCLADWPQSQIGSFFKVEGRSSLANKGIFPIGGIVDPIYRGEIKVMLVNGGEEFQTINKGDRIAQLVLYAVARPGVDFQPIQVADIISETVRGDNGFGSTGK
jgi:dUTP pyrophosphatase